MVLEHIQWLKQQYPDSVLLTEFITHTASEYAVRALIQIGDRLLSTGMAASANLETAEDRARVRAIEALGMRELKDKGLVQVQASPSVSGPTSVSLSPEQSPSHNQTVIHNPAELSRPKPTKPIKAPRPSLASPSIQHDLEENGDPPLEAVYPPNWSEEPPDADPSFLEPPPDDQVLQRSDSSDSDLEDSSAPAKSATLVPTHDSSSEKPEESTIAHAEPQHGLGESGGNVNLVDAIAKTSVEMHRLGWDTNQGRQHLQFTYGKRSRGELTDDELLDFLQFLEKQPNTESH